MEEREVLCELLYHLLALGRKKRSSHFSISTFAVGWIDESFKRTGERGSLPSSLRLPSSPFARGKHLVADGRTKKEEGDAANFSGRAGCEKAYSSELTFFPDGEAEGRSHRGLVYRGKMCGIFMHIVAILSMLVGQVRCRAKLT